MGRPKVDNPKTARLPVVQVTPDKLEAYKAAAKESGSNFSQWVRGALDEKAKK